MSRHYILDGKEPRPVDVRTWAKWFEEADRQVADTYIDEVRISTVFLGLNHNYDEGPPDIFETLVFGGQLDGEMTRCATWEQAEAAHAEMVLRVEFAAKDSQSTNEH